MRRIAHSASRLRISTGSAKPASDRNSAANVAGEAARSTAAARTKRFTTTTARNITPRLQKFGRRMPVPV
jgi:hypothetical protein